MQPGPYRALLFTLCVLLSWPYEEGGGGKASIIFFSLERSMRDVYTHKKSSVLCPIPFYTILFGKEFRVLITQSCCSYVSNRRYSPGSSVLLPECLIPCVLMCRMSGEDSAHAPCISDGRLGCVVNGEL